MFTIQHSMQSTALPGAAGGRACGARRGACSSRLRPQANTHICSAALHSSTNYNGVQSVQASCSASCIQRSCSDSPSSSTSSSTAGSPWQNTNASARRRSSIVAHASRIKAIENFAPKFELEPEAKETLFRLLTSPAFCAQVARESGAAGEEQRSSGAITAFTELIFQPVPWSINTPKGMPAEFMQYSGDPAHIIINVPPNFMFAAKISNPSRLCAIYRWDAAAS